MTGKGKVVIVEDIWGNEDIALYTLNLGTK
jgi:hypothetical protein